MHLQAQSGGRISIDGDGPFGGSMASVDPTFAPILAGLLLPAVTSMRERGNRMQAGNILRQLTFMVVAFADEFKKGAPKDIEELFTAYPDDMSRDLLRIPGGEYLDQPFIYARPQVAKLGAKQPVMIENPAARGFEGMNVCFGDTHVEFVAADEANGDPIVGNGPRACC